VSKPQHRTPEHRAARVDLGKLVNQGEAYCAEPVCLMPTRWIEPGSEWHVCHDPSGLVIIGPGHAHCNTSEGATRGNRMRVRGTRWSL